MELLDSSCHSGKKQYTRTNENLPGSLAWRRTWEDPISYVPLCFLFDLYFLLRLLVPTRRDIITALVRHPEGEGDTWVRLKKANVYLGSPLNLNWEQVRVIFRRLQSASGERPLCRSRQGSAWVRTFRLWNWDCKLLRRYTFRTGLRTILTLAWLGTKVCVSYQHITVPDETVRAEAEIK